MFRITRTLTRVAPLVAFCAVVLAGHASRAQDTALFTTRVPPNVMLIIDTSGSMNTIVWHPMFRLDAVYNAALCPTGYVVGSPTCTKQYLRYPLCNMVYGQAGFDADGSGSAEVWSNVPDNSFRLTTGHNVTIPTPRPAGCVSTARLVFHDPEVNTAGNLTRWQLEYLQWYFSQNVDVDWEGDGQTVYQEIISTTNGTASTCLLNETPAPPVAITSPFGKYRRARITAAQNVLRDVICQTNAVADLRYGVAKFDSNGTDPAGGFVRLGINNYTTAHRDLLVTRIEALEGEAWTPLGETLFNVYRYFQSRTAGNQAVGKAGGTNRFPLYNLNDAGGTSGGTFPGSPVTHECQKHFVVFITDGEPTKDRFDNGSSSALGTTFANFDNNLIGDFNTTPTEDETPPNNFFAPVMDGNSCGGSGGAAETCGVGLYLDDVAKFMHDRDFSPVTHAGNQTIDTYMVGFSTAGTANTVMQRAADVGGGDFYSSDNPDELTTAITNAINSIVAKSQAFTSAAVPASRTTSGDNFYSAFFLPVLDSPMWVGHLKDFDFSASGEVLTPTGNCAIGVDPTAVPPCADTGALRTTANAFWDAASAMPAPASRKLYLELASHHFMDQPTALISPVTAAEVTASGATLASAAYFNVVTGDYTATPYSVMSSNAVGPMASALSRYLRGCTFAQGPACTARNDGAGGPEYLGDIFHSNPLVVGSPNSAINESTYTTFATTWRQRPRVVYAGANDGWLHAFQAGVWSTALNPDGHTRGNGQELMGFMPYGIRKTIKTYIKNISGIRTTVTVDGSPIAADVWFNRTGTNLATVDPNATSKTDTQWRTVLIQGLRDGGQSYHALDITDPPTAASVTTTTYPRYLWGFPVETDAVTEPTDNPVSDGEKAWMGNTWSEPVITRVYVLRPGQTGRKFERWVAIFGAGYDITSDPNHTSYNATASKGRAIYMVDISTGEVLAKKRFVGSTTATTTERMAMTELKYAFASAPAVFDLDFDGFADVIYIGDLGGNLWKWVVKTPGYDTITASTTYAAPSEICSGCTKADQPNWPFRLFFRGNHSTASSNALPAEMGVNPLPSPSWVSGTHYQSFFFPPTGVLRQGTLALAFGAGERANPIGTAAALTDGCPGTASACLNNNHFYVVKDNDPLERVGTMPARITDRYTEGNLLNPDAATPPTCSALTAAVGYMITARDGEKFVSNSTIFLGTVFTGSFLYNDPTAANICDSKGTAFLYGFDLDCGVGEFPGPGDNAADRRMAIGSGLPTRPRVSVGDLNQGGGGGCPSPPCCINKVVVVTSDGEIYNDCPDDLPTSGVKVRSWRER
jgi:type IV pilus assembly protein PilY1